MMVCNTSRQSVRPWNTSRVHKTYYLPRSQSISINCFPSIIVWYPQIEDNMIHSCSNLKTKFYIGLIKLIP